MIFYNNSPFIRQRMNPILIEAAWLRLEEFTNVCFEFFSRQTSSKLFSDILGHGKGDRRLERCLENMAGGARSPILSL